MSTTRLESFSDGVFAIAITLLVLLIRVPTPTQGSLIHSLTQLWPSYCAYVVSFLTIGIIWVNHHVQFQRIAKVDRTLLFQNLVLLMWVSLLPFPTALVANFLKAGQDRHTATAIYAAALLAMSLSFYFLWRHARAAGLLHDGLPAPVVRRITRRNVVGQAVYAAALGMAFISPPASLAMCGAVALYYAHPGRTPVDTTALPSA